MTDKKDNRHLFYLHELSDYKVASDNPDVRGWKVKDAEDRIIGKVDNLLVNKSTEKVVYLDVEVDSSIIEKNRKPYGKPSKSDVHEFLNKDGETHLIIPIGHASLNEDKKFVYTEKINHQTFAETKRKEKGAPVDRDYEMVVLESYNRDTKNARTDSPGTSSNPANRDTDTGRVEGERRADTSNENVRERRTTEGRNPDDDTFYDQEDFDRKNFRQK